MSFVMFKGQHSYRSVGRTASHGADEMTMRDSRACKWLLLGLAVISVALVHRGVPAKETDPGFRVIVHAENPTLWVTREDVSKLMLKKSIRWEDGTEAYPVDLAPGSPVRDAFSELIHGRSTETVVKYWQRQVFSGRTVPPPTVASDQEVVAYVRSHPGGIGYVSAAARLEGVREIDVADL